MPETAEKPAMPDTLSVEAYVAEVLAALTPLPAVDTPLFAAHGLVLAQDVTAALPVPPWTNSAMDGYAVRARDTESAVPQAPVILPVAGDVPAGTAPAPCAAPSTAPLPAADECAPSTCAARSAGASQWSTRSASSRSWG